MPTFELIGLLGLAALAWLWFDSSQARDTGIKAARAMCENEGLQLLDETVSLVSLKPVRDEDGRLLLGRVYNFEYSESGNDRLSGSVIMVGQEVVIVRLAAAPTLH